MGLEHLPPQTRFNDRGCATIFNDTWDIHDELFDDVCNWDKDGMEIGVIYERYLTFRNYRFYYGRINPSTH